MNPTELSEHVLAALAHAGLILVYNDSRIPPPSQEKLVKLIADVLVKHGSR